MSKARKIILILGVLPAAFYVWGFCINWKAAGIILLAATGACILNAADRREKDKEARRNEKKSYSRIP